jgi:uncharacterized protein YlxW (UPF0749 family)
MANAKMISLIDAELRVVRTDMVVLVRALGSTRHEVGELRTQVEQLRADVDQLMRGSGGDTAERAAQRQGDP